LTLILRMGQWPCCCFFCQYKLPICRLCLTVTKSLCNYHTYKTQNHLRSVDAHSHNGAVTVLLSLVPITAANTLVLPNSDQITIQIPYLQEHKIVDTALTLILRLGKWPCCRVVCLLKLPIRRLCLTVTKSLFNYHTYKTNDYWPSFDAHSPNGAETVLLSVLPKQAADILDMPNSDQITIQ